MENLVYPARQDPFAALRYKDFRSYFIIQFFFTFACQIQVTILGFYIYQLTHSKLAIAFLGLSEAIPAIGMALFGGYIADKCEKRTLLLCVYSGSLLTAAVMFGITRNTMNGAPHTSHLLPILYAMVCCNGIARAFYEPASSTIYAQSIPREHYANASNWSSLGWQTAWIIGPLTGSFIYAFAGRIIPGLAGITATFATIIILLLLSLVLVYRLRKYPAIPDKKEKIWKSLGAGFRFVFNNQMMLYAMSLDLFSVFFGGVIALLPIYALDILKVGAEGLGFMRMAFSLGAALTMVTLVRFPPTARPWRNLLIAVAGFGCSIIAFGLSHSFILSLICLFAQGAFDSVSVVIRSTLMQLLTPDPMRGRVSAVNHMFIGSSSEIGNFESGIAAKLLGTIPAVLFGGCMTLVIAIFTYGRTKKLIHLSLSDISSRIRQDSEHL
jgi:MFS family permease